MAKAVGIKAVKNAEKKEEKRGSRAQHGSDGKLLIQDRKEKRFRGMND